MSPRPTRLALRIYLVSLTPIVAVLGAALLYGWLVLGPPRHQQPQELRFAVEMLSRAADPSARQRIADGVLATLHTELSVYAEDGSLRATNVLPPLPALSAEERDQLQRRGSLHHHGFPPRDATPLLDGYCLTRPQEPPHRPGPWDGPAWIVLALLLAASAASLFLARSLTRPLAALSAAARQLGSGDLSARARLDRGDELGELSRAFDEMADRVAHLLRSQQELLANVSHELRTPLARIQVALDLAAEGDAATAREALQEITADLRELEELVTDVLMTARLDLATGHAGRSLPALRFDALELGPLLEKSAGRFERAHPERTLELSLPPSLPRLVGDAVLLRRSVDNLLDNAARYSETHTPVRLSAEATESEITLAVQDRGIGIGAEDLPHITTPFFRTDKSRARASGGLGLGLSLARRITEAHGGRMEIESQLGLGTTVRMRLPRPAPPSETARE